MMIQTNPLCDNQRGEEKNVTFKMEEEKVKSVKNVNIFQREFYKTKFTDDKSIDSFGRPSQTFILIRDSCYSLVELPTFLSTSCTVQTKCHCSLGDYAETPLNLPDSKITLAEVLADYHPSERALLRATSQWTVMIVAISFFTTCLLLVGVMLSFTSEYQDITIARVLNGSNTNVSSII